MTEFGRNSGWTAGHENTVPRSSISATGGIRTMVSRGSLPKKSALNQNSPNPLNTTTTISDQLSTASNVSVKVFDLLGREVAGIRVVTFGGSRLASGIYFYRFETPKFSHISKMVLIK